MRTLLRLFLLAFLLSCLPFHTRAVAQAPEQHSASATAPSAESDKTKQQSPSVGSELAKDEGAASGEEENVTLKHSAMVRKLAVLTGGNVHYAHLLAMGLNFAIVIGIVVWVARKFVPGLLRNRTASIQHAIEEARAAGQDAHRRLTDIETRLRQLDVEIGQMQASAEKEGDAEETRIRTAAEEDIRKVIEAAELEIATAAKQARREIATHTADLAIALANKQIHVDSNTDQVLVRAFASKLTQDGKDGN
jgi:F0F1-type ATP synthase membrane subunit b/b'